MKIKLILLLAAFISLPLNAENVWKNDKVIKGVQALPDGGFIVYLEPGGAQGCEENRLLYVKADQNGVTADGINP